jgi:peptidoglycan/LPS O-acetylase OafA/YrhL
LGAVGSLLVVAAFILLYVESRKRNPPKKATFGAAAGVEAIGIVVYVMHLFPQSPPIMDMIGFLLFVAAFFLLCLALSRLRYED